ncbi:MAG: family 78 glycoside hydrolase catalytic domain, partial [Terracidiphilus sp.]
AWSKEAHWTQAPEWRAKWIAAPGADDPAAPLPLFRAGFRLAHPVRRAMLYASGLGQDELRLNGAKVGEDLLTPGWTDYRKTVCFDAYDVTRMLKPGPNAVGVMLGNGMYRVPKTPGRYQKFEGVYGPAMAIVQLHIDFADGSSTEILSGPEWKAVPGPVTFSNTYGGEDFDARREPAGWDRPGFDDSLWQAAQTVAGPGGTLVPEAAPPIRRMKVYAPAKTTQPKPGVTVYDLGQNFAGWPAIRVAGPAGSSVKLIPGELLAPTGLVSQHSSGEPQWFSYTLAGHGEETWHPRFSYYGFRYVQVETSGGARVLGLTGEAVHTSSAQAGSFTTSDPQLNRIHTLILRAIENNAVSLFTDCPHREKLGWLEETHLLAAGMLYDFDFAGLYAATARNIRDAQHTEGPTTGMAPEIAPEYVVFSPPFNDSPEWGSAAVLAPWYVYQRTGSLSFLAAQYDTMRAYTLYLGTRAHDGIVAYGLGDWYDIGPGEPGVSKLTTLGLTATATWYQDLRAVEAAAALLGKPQDQEDFHRQAEAVLAAFNARFFKAGEDRYDTGSQTAQAMPLALGMTPAGKKPRVLEALAADIHAHSDHVTAGDVGFHYLVSALMDSGRSDVLLAMLRRTDAPSYGYQLKQGATALTEAWDANPNSSQDHFMLGHIEEWFYRGLAGIDLDFTRQPPERLTLHPYVPAGLAHAQASYRSALGPIESGWTQGPAGTAYEVLIPPGLNATVVLDSVKTEAATVNGAPLATAPGLPGSGILASTEEGGALRLVLASGRYRIQAGKAARH